MNMLKNEINFTNKNGYIFKTRYLSYSPLIWKKLNGMNWSLTFRKHAAPWTRVTSSKADNSVNHWHGYQCTDTFKLNEYKLYSVNTKL